MRRGQHAQRARLALAMAASLVLGSGVIAQTKDCPDPTPTPPSFADCHDPNKAAELCARAYDDGLTAAAGAVLCCQGWKIPCAFPQPIVSVNIVYGCLNPPFDPVNGLCPGDTHSIRCTIEHELVHFHQDGTTCSNAQWGTLGMAGDSERCAAECEAYQAGAACLSEANSQAACNADYPCETLPGDQIPDCIEARIGCLANLAAARVSQERLRDWFCSDPPGCPDPPMPTPRPTRTPTPSPSPTAKADC